MRRRAFLNLLSGAAAWPAAARAQQADRMRRIGFLFGGNEASDPEAKARITAFRQGLEALGWTEGRNFRIDYRFGGGDPTRIRAHVAELVNSAPDLILANGSPAVAALKLATRTIPIVFVLIVDPVSQGFIESLARPGGNITGFTLIEFAMVGKWLEMLKEMAPDVKRAALMFNPETAPHYPAFLREFEAIPSSLAVELAAAPVHNVAEIEAAVAALAREPSSGLIIAPDVFATAHRALIITLAERHRLPAVYFRRQFVVDGGLLSYGPDTEDIIRRSAAYVDRILKGEKPADLPAQAPVKFDLFVNLKTAKALGLTIPPTILVRAEEVIE